MVYGWRVFVRRILDAICTLRSANHKCVLTLEMQRDIQWWKEFMHSFNGMSLIINKGPDIIVSVCNESEFPTSEKVGFLGILY